MPEYFEIREFLRKNMAEVVDMMLAEDQEINALELVGAAREKKGRIEGIKTGIAGTVKVLRSLGYSDDLILEKIKTEYKLSGDEAKEYLK